VVKIFDLPILWNGEEFIWSNYTKKAKDFMILNIFLLKIDIFLFVYDAADQIFLIRCSTTPGLCPGGGRPHLTMSSAGTKSFAKWCGAVSWWVG
jgi:hypothetical protein